ncbi:NUDIX hydrolase [Mucilaginibacter myungsuensis]|uniref:NUDIX hydrolase n=1 Tax=Mucilaginibacter myungsuensis TaxID=649104 RepID=A0A929PVN9_9SPHI|nr:NUDIX domain-containing protein [Mucilaginibacter myungsuensis]MBE9661221.1 NUDIX hydrolase [Mucilaginibacter myungsuensis]MDN3597365.1 NUDIX domain-containing protein [Mucilaginibacter myungsuensis]
MAAIQNIKVSVDAVVFGYTSKEGLSVLLIKRKIEPFKDSWALPGGLVLDDESLEDAVQRELEEETSVNINYLEQLYSFGKPGRDPRNRVVSVTYYGLVKPDGLTLEAQTDAAEAAWFNMRNCPKLAFDHQDIIVKALQRLKGKIRYEPIGFELLDEKFPFSELEKLYATVLERPIDRRNFKKKIMKFGFIIETNEKQQLESAGRPGNLFCFDQAKYFELKKQGIAFEI